MRPDTLEAVQRMNSKVIDTDAMIEYLDKKAKGMARMAEMSEFAAKDGDKDFHAIRYAEFRYEQRHMEAILDRLRLVKSMVEAVKP